MFYSISYIHIHRLTNITGNYVYATTYVFKYLVDIYSYSFHNSVPMYAHIIVVIVYFWFLDYLRQAVKIQTVVDKVFGGKTVNTVVCRECQNVSLHLLKTMCI